MPFLVIATIPLKFIKQQPLFSLVPHHFLKEVIANIREAHFFKGKHVYQEGEPADCIYIAFSGEFVVTKRFFYEGEYLHNEDMR
jgi:CRP-like cAMP-binding protein